MANGDLGEITGWTILQSAQLGDKTCLAIVEELERYLGLGIATLVNLFNPSIIVLDHRLRMAGDSFLEQVTRVVKRQALGSATTNLRFSYATLGSDGGLLGAALTVLEKLFEIPALKPPRFLVERSLIETLARRRRARASGGNSVVVVPNAMAVSPA